MQREIYICDIEVTVTQVIKKQRQNLTITSEKEPVIFLGESPHGDHTLLFERLREKHKLSSGSILRISKVLSKVFSTKVR